MQKPDNNFLIKSAFQTHADRMKAIALIEALQFLADEQGINIEKITHGVPSGGSLVFMMQAPRDLSALTLRALLTNAAAGIMPGKTVVPNNQGTMFQIQ
jgi:hypothetical protein